MYFSSSNSNKAYGPNNKQNTCGWLAVSSTSIGPAQTFTIIKVDENRCK